MKNSNRIQAQGFTHRKVGQAIQTRRGPAKFLRKLTGRGPPTRRSVDPFSSPYLPNYASEEETRFTMAKIQFDNFHYLKCIQVLDEEICTSPKSDFLRLYAELKFIIYNGTRDLHDEITICASHTIQSHPSFENLKRKLERKADRGQLDAFGLYLYGLVLNANKEKDEARKVLIESIKR